MSAFDIMARACRRLALCAAIVGTGVTAFPALAQSAPADNMTAARYDVARRVVGTIASDPDGIGAGTINFAATRTTYNSLGLPTKIESGELASWQTEAVAPKDWTGFTVFRIVDTTYDVMGRKTKDVASTKDAVTGAITVQSVTQFSYTLSGDPECTAQRMNPAVFASLPVSACTLGTEGTQGKDRITKNVYYMPTRLQKVQRAFGTALQQDYVTYTYTANGKQKTVTDANGTTATYDYDGHDRLKRWRFPSKTTAGVSSASDFEEYGYDLAGRRTTLRKRDGSVLTFAYDALGRVTSKTVPERGGLASTHTRDLYYDYDLRGLQLAVRFDSISGEGVSFTYDNHGRLLSSTQAMDGTSRALTYQWNRHNLRTRVTRPDANYTIYGYDGLDRLLTIHNGGSLLVTQGYNAKGEVTGRTLPNAATALTYDALSRPASLSHDMSGTGGDVTFGYGYNPASQIASRSRNNDAYIYGGDVNIARSYAVNGLNQYVSTSTGAAFCYDANGNLTADGTSVFLYDVENRLVEARAQVNSDCAALLYTGPLRASLRYDPLGRLYETNGSSGITRFEYDGDELVAEYASNGTILRRYTHGVGADDPVIWFEGATMGSNRRLLFADHQGSIISVANASGGLLGINRYDEWGVPDATNIGKFQYTGQLWLPELGMYYYKARIYSPTLGRFMQVDPIGYKDQVNLYAYVGNDPINRLDPTGKSCVFVQASRDSPVKATCKVDDKDSFRKAGYSSLKIRSIEKTYTKEVNRLLRSPNSFQTISVGNREATVRSGDVANGLMQSYVRYGKTDGSASTGGGWAGRGTGVGNIIGQELATRNPDGRPFQITLDEGFMNMNEEERAIAIIHEGIHTVPAEAVFQGMRGFRLGHQGPYQDAAEFFHALP